MKEKKQKAITYRYRTPSMRDWSTVTCLNMTEAKYIIRMQLSNFAPEDFKIPRGTIIERAT